MNAGVVEAIVPAACEPPDGPEEAEWRYFGASQRQASFRQALRCRFRGTIVPATDPYGEIPVAPDCSTRVGLCSGLPQLRPTIRRFIELAPSLTTGITRMVA